MTAGSQYKVYLYIFPNGMKYVGVTSKPLEIRRDNGYQHNKRLQAAIKEYGWRGFRHEVVLDGLTQEKAFAEEERLIKDMDLTNPQKGYNISLGGKSTFKGLHHSEAHKERMSNLLKGRSFSEEHLQHLKDCHAKERIPVLRIDAINNQTVKYESLGKAAESVGGHKTNISRSCKSGSIYKGYKWQYAETEMI